ncbi:MAG: aldehyde dehydrogenase family protein [Capsulimonadaceae bacterium]
MEETQQLYIGGRWVDTEERQAVRSPWNGAIVGWIGIGGERETEAAIAAAHAARAPLAGLTNAERSAALGKIADGIAAEAGEIARTLSAESGKPIRSARGEVLRAVHTFRIGAEEAHRFGAGETIPLDREASSAGRFGLTRRFPAGVVGAITPFNFQLNLVAHKVAPALAAGCPVVLKPAHQTPLTAFHLARIVDDTAGLPPGALNVVHTAPALGERLATDPRVAVLSFTGSGGVGWRLKGLANRKKVILELGGNAAAAVHDDADLDAAAACLTTAAFAYAGQVCISAQRLFVHRSVFDPFVDRLVTRTRALRIGDPASEETDIGPMISEAAADRVRRIVRAAVDGGATLLCGSYPANFPTGRSEPARDPSLKEGGPESAAAKAGRNIIEPVLLTHTTAEMAVNREEAFGPVATVEPYDTWAEAVARMNDSAFGLQASVFTNDLRLTWEAFARLEVGAVIVNDGPSFRVDHMPYGGVKDSGIGREGVRYAMEEMSELRLLVIRE